MAEEKSCAIVVNMETEDLEPLLTLAWNTRRHALVSGRTTVGAAVLASDGSIFGGCNMQHRYRSQDVHAEIAALAAMIGAGRHALQAIAVVAAMDGLAPCGACLDWILQLGGDACTVAWQSDRGGLVTVEQAGVLMPFHPPYQ